MSVDSSSVLIIAAEASSVLYAQRILEAWKLSNKKVSSFGIGNEEMIRLGFEALGRSEDLAVVGLQEVFSHWKEIKAAFHRVLEEVDKRKPKFALLLDYPGFNLRLARQLKKRGIKVIYYISPQVWAWKKGRVKEMKVTVDKVLTLFPFENSFYEKHGVPVEFVGHPLLDEIANLNLSEETRCKRRLQYGLDDGDHVVGLMPGSRKSELKHHLSIQVSTGKSLVEKYPQVKLVLLMAPGLKESQLEEFGFRMNDGVQLIKGDPFEMIHLCDSILCASGTATLMVGLMQVPMVIMYRMNPFTAFVAKRLVGADKKFGMVNLVLDQDVAPECFQEEANPKNLTELMEKYIIQDEFYKDVKKQLAEVSTALGDVGATQRVVAALEAYF